MTHPEEDIDRSTPPDTAPPKRAYRRPELQTFGTVAALTQSASCNEANDSVSVATCTAGSNMAMKFSDRSAKERIVRVGTHPLGIGLYLFDYTAAVRHAYGLEASRAFGVMADEVERVMPAAVVTHPDGYKMVDYDKLGISHPVSDTGSAAR
jgi:hypothetical protein